MDPIILAAALENLELQKKQIEEKIATVKAMMSGRAPAPMVATAPVAAAGKAAAGEKPKKARKRRTLSPEARERIAAAQKKRWAALKKTAK
jgi:hypothetical protein